MSSNKLSIFVFIDALGYSLLERFSFLPHLLPFQWPLNTVFGYSAACIPSILTGKKPCEHGHFSFFYYSPKSSPFAFLYPLSILPTTIAQRGRVRNIISRLVQKSLGYDGYFQLYAMPFQYIHLFDYSEKRDLYQKGGINSGHSNIFTLLSEQGVNIHVSNWRLSDEDNFNSCQKYLEQKNLDFAYVYTGGLDGFLHTVGPESPKIADRLRYYEQKITALYETAQKKYDEVQLFVFSDHGMHKIKQTSDLMLRILARPERFGTDYVAVFDSTMIRFWFLKETAKHSLTAFLQTEATGRILTDDELTSFGAYFPDHKYGELFFLLNSHVLLCPSFLGRSPLAGMHGYHPQDKDSLAMLASNQNLTPPPQNLCDMFTLMLSVLL